MSRVRDLHSCHKIRSRIYSSLCVLVGLLSLVQGPKFIDTKLFNDLAFFRGYQFDV